MGMFMFRRCCLAAGFVMLYCGSNMSPRKGDGVSAPILLMSLSMDVMSGGIMNSKSKLCSCCQVGGMWLLLPVYYCGWKRGLPKPPNSF